MNKSFDILKKYNEKYALNSFQNIEDKVVINYLKKENKMSEFETMQKKLKTIKFVVGQMMEKIDNIESFENLYDLDLPKEIKDKYINQQFEDYNAWKEIFITQGNLMNKGE